MPPSLSGPLAFPISVKGVVVRDETVLLLRNEREEWELPGGKIELGESPEECLAREIEEETGWPVQVGRILDSWMYYIAQADKHVFIVTYGCHAVGETPLQVSSEHKEAALFGHGDVESLPMPEGYKRSIRSWFTPVP